MIIKIMLIVIIAFCLLGGCRKVDSTIFQNKAFTEICSLANVNNKSFCIVLTDSTQKLSKEYCLFLRKNYNFLVDELIYNIVDINSSMNEWYVKWLCPISLPLTCVFSSNGTLIDLIPGANRETFLYTEEIIKNMNTTDFHWPNRFLMNKKRVIPLLNNLLQNKECLDHGIYQSLELNQLIDTLHYPYANYLKLIGELMMRDTLAAHGTAKSLLKLETPYFLELYKNEFITAKKVLNPDYNINNEPSIRIDKNIIYLSGCLPHKSELIEILIHNDGNQSLKISKIHTSCSCLRQANDNEDIIIGAKESSIVKFHFTPDAEGEISRDIFITSNAINMPVLYIHVLANTIPNYTNN